jgi:hypothetical protein
LATQPELECIRFLPSPTYEGTSSVSSRTAKRAFISPKVRPKPTETDFARSSPIRCKTSVAVRSQADIAIALFVLDVFLVTIGWPATVPDESFAESFVEEP